MSVNKRCPSCGSDRLSIFYELRNVPVHSVVLLRSREEALGFPTGDIALASCSECDFIHNAAFRPELVEYFSEYESTQAFSSTFNAFHTDLAKRLIERYNLHGKQIIEIGCGHGEFLALLCTLGDNRGVGFDPAYVPGRHVAAGGPQTTFIKDYYSEKYSHYWGDFLCCKMTLEHIRDTATFVETVRRSLGDRTDTTVFFQVPDATRILREVAFWDIYYEHCSYFTAAALEKLFRRCGFDVVRTSTEYDDQYLMIEARPTRGNGSTGKASGFAGNDTARDVAHFSHSWRGTIEGWRRYLHEIGQAGRRAVVWGGGSKAVAFLTTLGESDAVAYAVDINPHKDGTYLAGTGQQVIPPEFLRDYRPHVVVVMNPIYIREIGARLRELGVSAELVPLGRSHRANRPAGSVGDRR